jgi:hypothetical protein
MNDTDPDESAALEKVAQVARTEISKALEHLFSSGKYDVMETGSGGGGGSRRQSRQEDTSRSVRDEVLAAVTAAKEKDQEKSERQSLLDKIRDLEAKAERKPRQHRPITTAMWGEDD